MIRDYTFNDLIHFEIEKRATNPELIKAYCEKLNKNYKIPNGVLTDYMTLRVPTDDASDFVLFALSDVYLTEEQKHQYFSDAEFKKYSKTKYRMEKLRWPLEFPMIQINSSQWIGKITVKELMRFRDAHIIRYNERTQRTMERKIANGFEYYQIAINPVAVQEIEDSYERDAYIPNTITLNMPDDAQADFEYDNEQHLLRIHSLNYFDILDGYHRYRAMSKAVLKDPKFDYEMELRIVNFAEDHARQFIWQEDQKTKMSKVDSDSYKQDDYAVYICERLATSFPSGIISRNKGVIDLAELVIAVRYFYNTTAMKRSEVISAADEIRKKLRRIIEEDPGIIDTRWKRAMIYCCICICHSDVEEPAKAMKELYSRSTDEEHKEMWEGVFSQRKATALTKLISTKKKGRR